MSAWVEHLLAVPGWLVLLGVFALPALESSIFLGFVFPGELAVLLGGVAASQGHTSPFAVAAAAVAGAIVGDGVGYLVGRRWGRPVLDSTLGRFVRAEHLDKAGRALSQRGGWAVLVGRFTVALRVMIPGLAGMARMPVRRFAVANITGGALWGSVMATVGYLAGSSWQHVQHYVAGAGAALTGAVIAVVAGLLVHRLVSRLVLRHRRRIHPSTRPLRTVPEPPLPTSPTSEAA